MKTGSEKRISFWHLFSLNTLYYVSMALYGPFLSAYYRMNGITTTQIGYLSMISSISSIFIQPLWARRADRTGKTRTTAAFITACCAVALMTYLLGTSFTNFLFSAAFLALFTTSVAPLVDSIVIRNAHALNYDFARIRLGGTIGYAIVVYFIGSYLKGNPKAAFVFAAIAFLIFAAVIRLLPDSEDKQPIVLSERKKISFNLDELFQNREVIFILLFAFVFQLGAGFSGAYLSVYAVDVGYTQADIGIMQFCSATSEIPILLIAHRIFNKFGATKLIAAGTILMGIRILIVSGGNLTFFICAQLMQGLTYMVIHFGTNTYISENAKVGKASECQSVLHLVQTGFASILAYMFGGPLIEAVGFRSSYILVGSCLIISALVLSLILFTRKKSSVKAAA